MFISYLASWAKGVCAGLKDVLTYRRDYKGLDRETEGTLLRTKDVLTSIETVSPNSAFKQEPRLTETSFPNDMT